MSSLGVIGRLVSALVRSQFASAVARHVIREATAAVVREVRGRTKKRSTPHMH